MRVNKKKNPLVLFLLVATGLVVIVILFLWLASEDNKSIFNLMSLIGTYITFVGFAIALWQINVLKTTSEATEIAISETREGLKRISTVSDISRHLTIIRQIKEYVLADKYDIAQLRLYELKDFLTAMEQESGIQIDKDALGVILKNAKSQLSAVDNKLNNNVEIKKATFTKAMEEIATGLVSIKTNL